MLSSADAAVLIVTQNSLRAQQTLSEFSIAPIVLGDARTKRLIVLTTDSSTIPEYLSSFTVVDGRVDPVRGMSEVVRLLGSKTRGRKKQVEPSETFEEVSRRNIVREVASALKRGRLTVVCGAGISVDAGVPVWNELLALLLERMLKRIGRDNRISVPMRASESLERTPF